jgi:hypothetical protein
MISLVLGLACFAFSVGVLIVGVGFAIACWNKFRPRF